jgi:hypothetical protein
MRLFAVGEHALPAMVHRPRHADAREATGSIFAAMISASTAAAGAAIAAEPWVVSESD